MKITITHPNPDAEFVLNKLKSPENESSILKNVPLGYLSVIKEAIREAFPGKRIYVKYRGPRQSVGSCSGTCLKKHAESAAIYFGSEHRTYDRSTGSNYREWQQVLRSA